jgi:hypothetical protein
MEIDLGLGITCRLLAKLVFGKTDSTLSQRNSRLERSIKAQKESMWIFQLFCHAL